MVLVPKTCTFQPKSSCMKNIKFHIDIKKHAYSTNLRPRHTKYFIVKILPYSLFFDDPLQPFPYLRKIKPKTLHIKCLFSQTDRHCLQTDPRALIPSFYTVINYIPFPPQEGSWPVSHLYNIHPVHTLNAEKGATIAFLLFFKLLLSC